MQLGARRPHPRRDAGPPLDLRCGVDRWRPSSPHPAPEALAADTEQPPEVVEPDIGFGQPQFKQLTGRS